jgi:hypothetical protein
VRRDHTNGSRAITVYLSHALDVLDAHKVTRHEIVWLVLEDAYDARIAFADALDSIGEGLLTVLIEYFEGGPIILIEVTFNGSEIKYCAVQLCRTR